jgi:hypothetical protein
MKNHGGMISTGEVVIRPSELSSNPTSSHIVAKEEELGERNEFGLSVYTSNGF